MDVETTNDFTADFTTNPTRVMPGTTQEAPGVALLRAKRGYRKRIVLLGTIVIAAVASALFTLFAAVQSLRLMLAEPDASIILQAVAAIAAVAATVGAAMIAISELKSARAGKSRWYKHGGSMLSC